MVAAKPCRTTQGFLYVRCFVIFVISLVLSHFKLVSHRYSWTWSKAFNSATSLSSCLTDVCSSVSSSQRTVCPVATVCEDITASRLSCSSKNDNFVSDILQHSKLHIIHWKTHSFLEYRQPISRYDMTRQKSLTGTENLSVVSFI